MWINVVSAAGRTYAERLGWAPGSRVVMFHVDDAGLCTDSNNGTLESINSGAATSASVMMPYPDAAPFAKSASNADLGIHLTFTSEWKNFRCSAMTGRNSAGSLLDSTGNFPASTPELAASAKIEELELEACAQIEAFSALGTVPTHIDSHMFSILGRADFLELYLRLAENYRLPALLPAGEAHFFTEQWNACLPDDRTGLAIRAEAVRDAGRRQWNAGLPVPDDVHISSCDWPVPEASRSIESLRSDRTGRFIDVLKQLAPGVTVILIHSTIPTEIFRSFSAEADNRLSDTLAMTDPGLRKFIAENGIILTNWGEMSRRRKAAGGAE